MGCQRKPRAEPSRAGLSHRSRGTANSCSAPRTGGQSFAPPSPGGQTGVRELCRQGERNIRQPYTPRSRLAPVHGPQPASRASQPRTFRIHPPAHSLPVQEKRRLPLELDHTFHRYALRRISLTCTAVHAPPRAVFTPPADSALATPRRLLMPLLCIWRMIGSTPAANESAAS
jgi:hypothetical protein